MADGDLKPPEHNSGESTIDSRPSNVLTLEKIADGKLHISQKGVVLEFSDLSWLQLHLHH